MPKFAKNEPTASRIVKVLSSKRAQKWPGMTAKQISEKVNAPVKSVYNRISELRMEIPELDTNRIDGTTHYRLMG